ncbi:hypothetical protein AAMO2058_001029700 [Amorphochlora amoebiformis]
MPIPPPRKNQNITSRKRHLPSPPPLLPPPPKTIPLEDLTLTFPTLDCVVRLGFLDISGNRVGTRAHVPEILIRYLASDSGGNSDREQILPNGGGGGGVVASDLEIKRDETNVTMLLRTNPRGPRELRPRWTTHRHAPF